MIAASPIPGVGAYEKSAEDYSRAIALDGKDPRCYNNRGNARFGDAIADYARALELDPNHATAFLGRGYAFQALGRDDQALADLIAAKQHGFADLDLYRNRGWLYEQRGDLDRACPTIRKASSSLHKTLG
jgi:tetratricopeptide (TPR) repeat protein